VEGEEGQKVQIRFKDQVALKMSPGGGGYKVQIRLSGTKLDLVSIGSPFG
jgi:hypothetical protein